jgi:hypothetical protein
MTDHLNSDICLVPTCSSITAGQLADIFFDSWFCENGLPLNIVSNRDKLFLSQFWQALHTQTGIKLKMLMVYHPEMDRASKQTNKIIIQALQFHVARNQKGWICTLPKVIFDLMNTVNRSTGFTPFQLHLGCLPRLLPPLLPSDNNTPEEQLAEELIRQVQEDINEAKDNLILAQVSQAAQANKAWGNKPKFQVGNFLLLNTCNKRREYQQKKDGQTAKLMPRFDGKHRIVTAYPNASIYTIDMPNSMLAYTTFHPLEL